MALCVPLQVSVIGGLQVKMGYRCIPMASLERLTEIASEVGEIAGQPMRPSQPFVGSSAFAHKGGIHVAAVRKVTALTSACSEQAVMYLDMHLMAGTMI